MDLKLFTALIDALVKLPKAERETMRCTLDETYRLIDTTLNMIIIRLGELSLFAADADFLAKRPGWTTTTNGCRPNWSSDRAIGKDCAYDCTPFLLLFVRVLHGRAVLVTDGGAVL